MPYRPDLIGAPWIDTDPAVVKARPKSAQRPARGHGERHAAPVRLLRAGLAARTATARPSHPALCLAARLATTASAGPRRMAAKSPWTACPAARACRCCGCCTAWKAAATAITPGKRLMRAAMARGWHGVVSHFRGCGGAEHPAARLPRRRPAEVAWLLARLASEGRPCAVGCRWRQYAAQAPGEAGASALCQRRRRCPPCWIWLPPAACWSAAWRASWYTRMFLRHRLAGQPATARRHPGLIDVRRAQASRIASASLTTPSLRRCTALLA